MTKAALIRFLNRHAQQIGEQMQLCCGRALGNLPTLPRKACDGRSA